MASKTVKVNGNTYSNVSEVKMPLASDTSQLAVFVETSDADATQGEILNGKKAYIDGALVTGSMTNNGAVSGNISTKAGAYTVQEGYHNGSGSVGISAAEQAKIVASNIKDGVTILGVEGNYGGEGLPALTNDAGAGDILLGKEAYGDNGVQITGTMVNNGTENGTISTKAGTHTVSAGYHNGSGAVSIASAEQTKIISDNIKSGVTILGVSGSTNVVDTGIASGGATASDVISGKKAYVNGAMVTGTHTDPSFSLATGVLTIS